MIITLLALVQGIVSCSGNDGYVTVLNLSPQSNGNTGYQCYIPTTFTGYNLSYGRSFRVADDESLNETSWNVPRDDRRYVVYDPVGMGVYYCKIVKDGLTTIVQTTKIGDDALITPGKTKNTVTVNVGDDVTISFNTDLNGDLEWRKDGSPPFKNGIDKRMAFNSVEISDSGVYEMYKSGNRSQRLHSFIKLIVRECPRHKWGPTDCTGDCEYCYNGGVCDDKTGFCICAPGFSGSTCEIECGGNKHGWNCENSCTRHTRNNACKNFQFCLPDPYGCSCVTGYTGLKCDTDTFIYKRWS
ncbi:angiopoietin-1 receptor-like [Antedon mediterranea]|uniref:angiopoietin-1 receptor-like n=1 Tax=Antedon mediterranea TaxID=105859 RepID=UPI003AF906F9